MALLHLVGWGTMLIVVAPRYPLLTGLAWLAYTLGLRHGFDADHIAAIDGTTRKLIHERCEPHGVGFYFSLGHSTVVLVLALALVQATRVVRRELPVLRDIGGTVGGVASGLFMCLLAFVNALLFIEILGVVRHAREGTVARTHARESPLERGGLMTRCFGRVLRLVGRPWHMFVVGFLFGLGFDTASEVALLAISAMAASRELPVHAVLTLPVIFAAGMSLVDTADGAVMARAYGWALAEPGRRARYNLVVTGVTAALALLIGATQLAATLRSSRTDDGLVASFLGRPGVGATIVALFVVLWGVAVLRARRACSVPRPVMIEEER